MAKRRGFGQTAQLPSKRHRARYRVAGTWHNAPTTFTAKVDAEGWLAAERRLIDRDEWTPPALRAEAKRVAELDRAANTFGTFASSWFDGRHDLRPSTRASYTTALDRHLIPTFGDLPLDQITTKHVRAWFNSYGDRTPTARAHAYQVLTTIMGQAEDEDIITRSPCRIRSGGRSPVKREAEVLTLVELLALADAMPRKHRALTLLCGLCGLRFGEAAALRRRDLDLDAGTLTVARTAVRAGGTKQAGPPKTAASARTVAMPAVVVTALREHMSRSIAGGRDGLVFPGDNGQLLAPTALYGRTARVEFRDGHEYQKSAYGFHGAREAIGRPSLHWHDLRRTAATLGAQSGASVKEMQHRLGHTTPTMALHYQSATADRDRAIADRLQAQVAALSRMAGGGGQM